MCWSEQFHGNTDSKGKKGSLIQAVKIHKFSVIWYPAYVKVHFQWHYIFQSLLYSINHYKSSNWEWSLKEGMAFGERKAEVFMGLESKFGCPLCERVQNYFIIHKSEMWKRYIYKRYIYIIPKINKHQKFLKLIFQNKNVDTLSTSHVCTCTLSLFPSHTHSHWF